MKNMTVNCRINPTSRTLDFYAGCSGESRYIFTRKYRRSLFEYFKNGVSVYKLFDLSRAHDNEIVINTILQMREALKYLEKETGIKIFEHRCDRRCSYKRRREHEFDFAA